jgi:hypothetical protein
MYGKVYSKEHREQQSVLMKKKILNGEFTPNTNNRNTHWEASCNGKKYRSSWEALYHYFNPDAVYEELRIKYSYNDDYHIYIVDFVDHNNKTVAEVKPSRLFNDDKTQCKITSLMDWCDEHGYVYIQADEEFLTRYKFEEIDIDLFDDDTIERIKVLYEKSRKL